MHLPSPFCPGYTTPAPSLCTSPHPACMPSPSAHMLGGAGGIACPPPVPSTWTTPMPPPQFTHPALPCMHALPLCHRRDSAPASLLCHAMQTLPPGLCPHPTHMSTHSPLYLDYSNATPPVYTPHPTCMPSPFAYMPGVQEDRWKEHMQRGGSCARGEGTWDEGWCNPHHHHGAPTCMQRACKQGGVPPRWGSCMRMEVVFKSPVT